jgi:PncC family amidohydrolase
MLAEELGRLLRAKGKSIATAESCTGGKVGDMITSVPGSSEYYLGGVISYSNHAKVQLLGVDAAVLRSEGAVSEPVALSMAQGVRRRLGSDIGLSTTGIAGPGGGTPAKPVGLVFIAVSSETDSSCERHLFEGSRDEIKIQSSEAVLSMALRILNEQS